MPIRIFGVFSTVVRTVEGRIDSIRWARGFQSQCSVMKQWQSVSFGNANECASLKELYDAAVFRNGFRHMLIVSLTSSLAGCALESVLRFTKIRLYCRTNKTFLVQQPSKRTDEHKQSSQFFQTIKRNLLSVKEDKQLASFDSFAALQCRFSQNSRLPSPARQSSWEPRSLKQSTSTPDAPASSKIWAKEAWICRRGWRMRKIDSAHRRQMRRSRARSLRMINRAVAREAKI